MVNLAADIVAAVQSQGFVRPPRAGRQLRGGPGCEEKTSESPAAQYGFVTRRSYIVCCSFVSQAAEAPVRTNGLFIPLVVVSLACCSPRLLCGQGQPSWPEPSVGHRECRQWLC